MADNDNHISVIITKDNEHASLPCGYHFNTDNQHLVEYVLLVLGLGNEGFSLTLRKDAPRGMFGEIVVAAVGSLVENFTLTPYKDKDTVEAIRSAKVFALLDSATPEAITDALRLAYSECYGAMSMVRAFGGREGGASGWNLLDSEAKPYGRDLITKAKELGIDLAAIRTAVDEKPLLEGYRYRFDFPEPVTTLEEYDILSAESKALSEKARAFASYSDAEPLWREQKLVHKRMETYTKLPGKSKELLDRARANRPKKD